MYLEDDMLMLSGIQHYMFCPRQWALIHIEQVWEENKLTAEGKLLHKNVDNPEYRQKNGERITLRRVPIASKELGLYGFSDAIELLPSNDPTTSIRHPRHPGHWIPFPIEYKHGHAKINQADEVQLTAQAMCLEEQYQIAIKKGALYYGETHSRITIEINDELREIVKLCTEEMHKMFSNGIIPIARKKKYCNSCSLFNICIPNNKSISSVSSYLKKNLY